MIRPMLSLDARRELDVPDADRVKKHLAACHSCSAEQAEFFHLMSLARVVALQSYQVPEAVRNLVVREAARRAARKPWSWLIPMPLHVPAVHPGMVVAAAAVVVALAALPVLVQRDPVGSTGGRQAVAKIQVVAEGELVRLAWSNGHKETYTVYKSDNPRAFPREGSHVVTGTVWTDTDPGSSPVVFYRVE